jgi:pyrroline-5-carboxylate reductase
MQTQITFLGGGNMASAITAGLIAHGHSPNQIHIVQRNPEKREALQQRYGVITGTDYAAAIAQADMVIFAVKPQSYPELMQEVASLLQARNPLVVSIMSGLRLQRLRADMPGLSIVRVMPNTPARVQAGLSLITPANPLVEQVFQAVGETLVTPTERIFEQLTALTGCGPAFVYYLVEQCAQAMQSITPEIDCLPLARATFDGALKMMQAEPSLSPTTLIAQVAPKGGMTAEALKVLGSVDLQDLLERTFQAAIDRGDELA